MSNQPQGETAQPPESHRGLRLLGLVAVAAGVLLLMAAAFVLSYTGIHAIALSAGVSSRFARIYPVIFDAMLVVACASVLALRGAGLPSRCYAWLTMLLLLGAAASADTLHATNTKLPHKPTAAAAAIIPWVLVLLGFGLLLSLLRHARLRRAMLAATPERAFTQPSGHVEVRQQHGLDDLFGSKNSAPAVRYVPPTKPLPAADAALDLAIESDPAQDDPSSDEGHPSARTGQRQEQPAGYRGNPASAFSPAPTMEVAKDTGTAAARVAERPAEAGTVPVPRRAAGPARAAKPAADTKPAAAARPKARPAAKAKPVPETKPVPEVKPAPETASAAEPGTGADPAPEAAPAADARPETGRGSASAATAKRGATTDTGRDPEPAPDVDSASGAETATEAGVDWDPLQFERVRSSPLPPEG
jgi:hypothetical protein